MAAMKKLRFLPVLGFLAATVLAAHGQDEERIRMLFQNAIETMGGEAFLKVIDMVTEGNAFFIQPDGSQSGLVKFLDYTKLPDKNRFELGNKKKSRDYITVFNLEKNVGWIFDPPKPVREATPEEMKDFRNSLKHNIDNIFRFRWKDPANRLFYLGPGEGTEVNLEMVKLLDPDNDEVTIYFDRMSKLPARLEYRGIGKNGVQERHVEEFSQWHVMGGVNTPLRSDGYINGKPRTQFFVVKITYNNNLQDDFFTKPEQPK